MCGRAYVTYTDEELKFRYFSHQPIELPKVTPNFNLSSTQDAPVILPEKGHLTCRLLKWGLIPFWAKDSKSGYKMINARAETLAEKPAFRAAFKSRRAIIPLSGFIEWKRDGDVKRPFCVHLTDDPIMSLAGIWENWKSPEGRELQTFSIITTEANSFMAPIHDRMPVILDEEGEAVWLDPKNDGSHRLQKLLKPCDPNLLSAFEVSTLINSPKNKSPEVLKPI